MNPGMKTNKDYALAYAQLGWHVIALKPNEKVPLPGSHGCLEATTDPVKITSLWEQYPDANIGIRMGKISGVFAVNIDPRNNGDISLEILFQEYDEFPDTVMANTGGNGTHYIFKYPESGEIPKQILMDGVDIIGENSYIVVEPSIHPCGGQYGWESSCDPLLGIKPADAPQWLLNKIRKKQHGITDAIRQEVNPLSVYVDPDKINDINSALEFISADDYKTWIDIGMSLTSLGTTGLTIWTSWSRNSYKFKQGETDLKWQSFSHPPPNGLKPETIFYMAQQNGWQNPKANLSPALVNLPYPYTALEDTRLVNRRWDLQQPPEQEFLINDKIPMATTGLIAGTGGSSKTQFILQLSCGIAAGADMFSSGNLTPPWCPKEAMKVLVLTAEESNDDLHRRIYNITQESGYTEPEKTLLRENLHICSVSGLNNLFTQRLPEGDYIQTQNVEDLLSFIKPIKRLGLIVFEPISRFRSGDENNNEAGTRMVEIMERLSIETGATVITASHTNKGTSNADELNQDAIRGASALVDGVRWAAVMRVMTNSEAKKYGINEDQRLDYVQFVIPKANNVAPQPNQWFIRCSQGFLQLTTLNCTGRNNKQDEYEKVIKKVINFIKKSPLNKYSTRKLEEEYAGKNGIFEIGQKSLRAIINRAVEEGKLVKDKNEKLGIPCDKATQHK